MDKKFMHSTTPKDLKHEFTYSNTDNFWNLPKDRQNQTERYKAVMEEIKSTMDFINYICDEYNVPTLKASLIRLNCLYNVRESIAIEVNKY